MKHREEILNKLRSIEEYLEHSKKDKEEKRRLKE